MKTIIAIGDAISAHGWVFLVIIAALLIWWLIIDIRRPP